MGEAGGFGLVDSLHTSQYRFDSSRLTGPSGRRLLLSFPQTGHITVTDCTREFLSGNRFLSGLLRGAAGHGESLISFFLFLTA